MSNATKVRWAKEANDLFAGRTIKRVRYMSDAEVEAMGWYSAAPVFVLDDGNAIWPSADDEGNNAGAMFTTIEAMEVVPVI